MIQAAEPTPQSDLLRIAFLSSMFTEVNEADARAAMRVWIMTVAKERGILLDPEPRVYDTAESALAASHRDPVSGYALTAAEYRALRQEIKFDRFAVGVIGGKAEDNYVVLVREGGDVDSFRQLEQRSLLVLQNPRMSLALVWLDNLLLQEGLRPAREWFQRIEGTTKSMKVALPVYFRQADACLMTQQSFATLCELNPQLRNRLRPLATSPAFITAGFAFRADFRSTQREQVLREMERLSESPAGQQILTLTKAERIEARPISCLESALGLLATHDRLLPPQESSGPGRTHAPPSAPAHSPAQP